jgi:hypothetical protein
MLTIMPSVSQSRVWNFNQFRCVNIIAKVIQVPMLGKITPIFVRSTHNIIKIS